jgi:hypothetical protein
MTATTNGTLPAPKRTRTATPETAPAGQVRHLYRASLKLGEDFRTLECEITVPVGASDDLIREAQDTARRVREAQAESTEREIDALREETQLASGGSRSRYAIRDPEVPASTKQRTAIERMAGAKGWDTTRLVRFCDLAGVPLLTLTKGGASWLIDALNGVAALPPVPASFTPVAPLPFDPEAGAGDATPAAIDPQDIPF